MAFRTLDQLDVNGKRVLLRVDFNVPMEDGQVSDDTRIQAALPTIRALLERGAAVVLVSHLGRPKGKPDSKYSLAPVAKHLAGLLGQPVPIAGDVVGPSAEQLARRLRPGEVAMLENVRFEPGEEQNDPALARQLANLADVFVNDAFGAAHRAHASTEGVAHLLPSAAGLLMARELEALGAVMADPARPLVVIMGGAKISDKIGVIEHFMAQAQTLLVGGGIANTFLKARGVEVGTSLVEDDALDLARDLLARSGNGSANLVLPVDATVARSATHGAEYRVSDLRDIEPEEAIFDIGPQTVRQFADVIAGARTTVWNGPMGLFEFPPFDAGTRGVAEAVARSESHSVVGGGDSVAALQEMGLADKISHISTGGGASLEFLEGRTLPGVAALEASAR